MNLHPAVNQSGLTTKIVITNRNHASHKLSTESDTAVLSLAGSSSAGDFLTYNIAQIGKSPLLGH